MLVVEQCHERRDDAGSSIFAGFGGDAQSLLACGGGSNWPDADDSDLCQQHACGVATDPLGFQAIEQVKPWDVDVATGVESAPGRKDPLKVRYFINAAKEGDDEEEWDAQELAGVPDMFDWQDESGD